MPLVYWDLYIKNCLLILLVAMELFVPEPPWTAVIPELEPSFWVQPFQLTTTLGSLTSSTPLLWTWPCPSSFYLSSCRCLSTWNITSASLGDCLKPQLEQVPLYTAAATVFPRGLPGHMCKESFHRHFLLTSNYTSWNTYILKLCYVWYLFKYRLLCFPPGDFHIWAGPGNL